MKKIASYKEYQEVYKKSVEQPEVFWAEIAGTFTWRKKWDTVLNWDFEKPSIKWFEGAKLNITENSSTSRLLAPPKIYRLVMKGKFDACLFTVKLIFAIAAWSTVHKLFARGYVLIKGGYVY